MSKLKKLLDKKKTNKPTPAVVKIEDQQKKEDDQNNFPSEFKEDQIDMIHNLQQQEIQQSTKDTELEKKENTDWSNGQIYKEVGDITKQVQTEIQNEEKKKENQEKKKESE